MAINIKENTLIDIENLGLFINGKWVTDLKGGIFEVKNPSTEETVAQIPKGGTEEAKKAISAADHAFPKWASLTAIDRSNYMLKLRDLMIEHTNDLATLMSMEMGKPFNESKGEVAFAASYLTWYSEEGRRIYGEIVPASSTSKRLFVIKQPIGVVAAITPWNFPLGMLARKLGAALAAGCTVVIKPASQATLSALAFAKLVEKAGFPNGVINIIAGATREISDELFANKIVKKISFTGSTEVGKQLVVKSADQLKKLSLELGGHAPFIIFEDADIKKAVEGVIQSKFRNAGQTCISANRIYVHESIEESFSKVFVEEVKKLKMGNSIEESVQIGPLVNKDGLEKVTEHVEDAIQKGATLLHGGNSDYERGYFYKPTVLSNVTEVMKIMYEETFGPVAPLTSFTHDKEVIEKANDTEFGLAAYLYTNDINRAISVSESLNYGVIGLNDGMPTVAQAPFGGMNQSGYGREGGHQGIKDYLEEKFISLDM